MSLRLLQVRPDDLSRTRHETARRPRPQKLAADLQIDNVVGAERFDEVGLDGDIAGALISSDLHGLRTNTYHELVFGAEEL